MKSMNSSSTAMSGLSSMSVRPGVNCGIRCKTCREYGHRTGQRICPKYFSDEEVRKRKVCIFFTSKIVLIFVKNGCLGMWITYSHPFVKPFITIITHWEKLLDSNWLSDCEFIRNLRANSVIRSKLQI